MAEWTPEARDYLEGYLRQVSALARQQGDDADEIVSELRGHIQREAEEAAGVMVTLDVLRKTLSAIGTPEQVAGVEAALTPPWRAVEVTSTSPRRTCPSVTTLSRRRYSLVAGEKATTCGRSSRTPSCSRVRVTKTRVGVSAPFIESVTSGPPTCSQR